MAMTLVTVTDDEERFSSLSLLDLCLNCCVLNAKVLLFESSHETTVPKSSYLPVNISEKLQQKFDPYSIDYPRFLQTLHASCPSLRKVHVRNCVCLKDSDLSILMEKYPDSLDIHNCPLLTKKTLEIINMFGANLESLCIGNSFQILPTSLPDWISDTRAKCMGSSGGPDIPSILRTPVLQKLVIWGLHVTQFQCINLSGEELPKWIGKREDIIDYWQFLMREFIGNLVLLDLSSCQEVTSLEFLLPAASSLTHLHIHDVHLENNEKTWGVLRFLVKLRYLDVSQYNELASVFPEPDTLLDKLVQSLPDLQALDISGTNLSGFEPLGNERSPIPGLVSRGNEHLQFLGLLGSHYCASGRTNIPAIHVAGGSSIRQLQTAFRVYLHRANLFRKTVRLLHGKLLAPQQDEFIPCCTLLDKLLEGMKLHLHDKHTAIISLSSIFYLVHRICKNSKDKVSELRLRHCLDAVLRAMAVHDEDFSVMKNSVLLLLILTPKLKITPIEAVKLVRAAVVAGQVAAGAAVIDVFTIKAITYILHLSVNSANNLAALNQHGLVNPLCIFMEKLFSKQYLNQMPSLVLILLQLIEDGSLLTDHIKDQPSSLYDRIVSVCFKVIKVCQDRILPEGDPGNKDLRSLMEMRKPILAFLTNLLINVTFAEDYIVQTHQIRLIFKLIKVKPIQDEELAYVTCGFLAQVAEKKAAHSLASDCVPPRILRTITNVMSQLDSKLYPYPFAFRRMNGQLTYHW